MEMAKSNLAQTRTVDAELSAKCENARKFLTENAKIEEELTSRKTELNAATNEIETKKLDLGNLRSEQQLLTTKLEALRRNFEESSGKTQHQDKEIAARQKKLDQLRDEIDTANILLEQRRVEESELTEKCGSSWQNLADKWKRGAGLARRKKT
jgi:peptidoglycan hydrolase CwlO-like protein